MFQCLKDGKKLSFIAVYFVSKLHPTSEYWKKIFKNLPSQ